MLEALKFVKGGYNSKSPLTDLHNYQIKNGRITSFNGHFTLSALIDFDIDLCPNAEMFTKAITGCSGKVSLSMTATGRLKVQSNKFKGFIDCTKDARYFPEPDGEAIQIYSTKFIDALKKVYPIIGEDQNRPWNNGAFINGNKIYATNNTIIVRADIDFEIPVKVNIPKESVKELLRLNENPIAVQYTDRKLTFHFADDKWMTTDLLPSNWPETDFLFQENNAVPLPVEFYTALDKLAPFVDELETIILENGIIKTHYYSEQGGKYELDGFEGIGKYKLKQFMLLKPFVTKIDFMTYPKPCFFTGEGIEGVLLGLKQEKE